MTKNFIIGVILIAGFIFIVSFSTFYAQVHIDRGDLCSCTVPIPLLIPILSSLGIFVGSLVYYLLFPKIEEDREKYTRDTLTLIDLLSPEEREIVKTIVESGGKVTQSKISMKIGKVKTHRILKELESRGVVEKERYGKTNMVKLAEKFAKIFSFTQTMRKKY